MCVSMVFRQRHPWCRTLSTSPGDKQHGGHLIGIHTDPLDRWLALGDQKQPPTLCSVEIADTSPAATFSGDLEYMDAVPGAGMYYIAVVVKLGG